MWKQKNGAGVPSSLKSLARSVLNMECCCIVLVVLFVMTGRALRFIHLKTGSMAVSVPRGAIARLEYVRPIFILGKKSFVCR
jgi:hypothetical protein